MTEQTHDNVVRLHPDGSSASYQTESSGAFHIARLDFNRAESELVAGYDPASNRYACDGVLTALAVEAETGRAVAVPVEINWDSSLAVSPQDAPAVLRFDQATALDADGKAVKLPPNLPQPATPLNVTLGMAHPALGDFFGAAAGDVLGVAAKLRVLERLIQEGVHVTQTRSWSKKRRTAPKRMRITDAVFDISNREERDQRHRAAHDVYRQATSRRHCNHDTWHAVMREMLEIAKLHEQLWKDEPKTYRAAVKEAVRDQKAMRKEIGGVSPANDPEFKATYHGLVPADAPQRTVASLQTAMRRAASGRHYDEQAELEVMHSAREALREIHDVLERVPLIQMELEDLRQKRERTQTQAPPTVSREPVEPEPELALS